MITNLCFYSTFLACEFPGTSLISGIDEIVIIIRTHVQSEHLVISQPSPLLHGKEEKWFGMVVLQGKELRGASGKAFIEIV